MFDVPRELLTHPCPCGGTNENCFKCGGWGYIDTIGLGLSTPKPPRVESNRQKKPLIQCSQCAAKVRNLKKHMKKVHTREMSLTVASKGSESTQLTKQPKMNVNTTKVACHESGI